MLRISIVFLLSLCFAKAQQPHVVYPNGSEHVLLADTMTIRWDGVSALTPVRLEYSDDGGNSWFPIAEEVRGLEYRWCPNTSASYILHQSDPRIFTPTYLIRVTQYEKSLEARTLNPKPVACANVTQEDLDDGHEHIVWSPDESRFAISSGISCQVWNVATSKIVGWMDLNRPYYDKVMYEGPAHVIAYPTSDFLQIEVASSHYINNKRESKYFTFHIPSNRIIGSFKPTYNLAVDWMAPNRQHTRALYLDGRFGVGQLYAYDFSTGQSTDLGYVSQGAQWLSETRIGLFDENSDGQLMRNEFDLVSGRRDTTNVATISKVRSLYHISGQSDEVSSDGEHLAFMNRTASRVVDLRTGDSHLLALADGKNTACKWACNSNSLAYVYDDGRVTRLLLYDLRLDSVTMELELAPSNTTIAFMSWSPSDRFLLVQMSDRTLRIVDCQTAKIISRIDIIAQGADIAWQPHKKILAQSTPSGVDVWDVDNSKRIATAPAALWSSASPAWTSDGSSLIYTNSDSNTIVWDYKTALVVDTVAKGMSCFAMSARLSRLFLVTYDSLYEYDLLLHRVTHTYGVKINEDASSWFNANESDLYFQSLYQDQYCLHLVSGTLEIVVSRASSISAPNPKSPWIASKIEYQWLVGYPDLAIERSTLIYLVQSDSSVAPRIVDVGGYRADGISAPAWNSNGQLLAFAFSPSQAFRPDLELLSSSCVEITDGENGHLCAYVSGPTDLYSPKWQPQTNTLAVSGDNLATIDVPEFKYWSDTSDKVFFVDTSQTKPDAVAESATDVPSMYPNPCSSYLHINCHEPNSCTLTLFDVLGNVVLRSRDIAVNLEAISNGTYLARISTATQQWNSTLIIRHDN